MKKLLHLTSAIVLTIFLAGAPTAITFAQENQTTQSDDDDDDDMDYGWIGLIGLLGLLGLRKRDHVVRDDRDIRTGRP